MEDVPLIELDSLEFENEESWLVPAPVSSHSAPATALDFRREHLSSSSSSSCGGSSGLSPPRLRKKSLIERIDEIASRSNGYYSGGGVYPGSPRRQHQLCSTPLRNSSIELLHSPVQFRYPEGGGGGPSNRTFDSRTFTRKAGARAERKLLTFPQEDDSPHHHSPTSSFLDKKLNLTFEKLELNSTFDKGGGGGSAIPLSNHNQFLNRTYSAENEEEEECGSANRTYDATAGGGAPHSSNNHHINENLNATFQMRKNSEDPLSTSSSPSNSQHYPPSSSNGGNNNNMSIAHSRGEEESSSHGGDLDDALSTTSDSSVSHRLNDVGDVQHIAKLQEESLKESPLVQSQDVGYARSATISPSSEHSPLTEEGGTPPFYHHNNHHPPEEPPHLEDESLPPPGPQANSNNVVVRYQQYSSQDSLPDSPYSSQSLDSQPAQGQDRLGRSMPNLNKIRRGRGVGGGLPVPPSMGGRPANYGCSDAAPTQRRSLAAMYQIRSSNSGRGGGGVSSSYQSASDSNLRNRSVSTRVAPTRPLMGPPSSSVMRSTGIPRPGSRIPAPSGIPRSSGIPKPSSSSTSRLPTSSMRKTSSYAGQRSGQYN